GALAAQSLARSLPAVTRDQDPDVLLAEIVEHAKPVVRIGVRVGDVVAGEIHAEIASEENFFLGQIRDRIAQRMPGAYAYEFHAMLAIVEDHLVLKADLRMLQPDVLQALLAGSRVLRPVGRILGFRFRHAFARADQGCARVHPNAISKSMIAVIMDVEHEANG